MTKPKNWALVAAAKRWGTKEMEKERVKMTLKDDQRGVTRKKNLSLTGFPLHFS